jgi:hypothetical protein
MPTHPEAAFDCMMAICLVTYRANPGDGYAIDLLGERAVVI